MSEQTALSRVKERGAVEARTAEIASWLRKRELDGTDENGTIWLESPKKLAEAIEREFGAARND